MSHQSFLAKSPNNLRSEAKSKGKGGEVSPKLVEGFTELSRSEPLVSCSAEENGEHVIAACCEPHVEICHVIVAGASGRGAVSV